MARIYRPESGSKVRSKMLRYISSALNHINGQKVSEEEQLDLIAFIVTCLDKIEQTVDRTNSAWEKRGYWVKADKFRRDWAWVPRIQANLSECLRARDLKGIKPILSTLHEPLLGHPPYKKASTEKPWQGSWRRFIESE